MKDCFAKAAKGSLAPCAVVSVGQYFSRIGVWGLGDIVFTFVCTYVVVTIIMFFVLLLRSKIKKKK